MGYEVLTMEDLRWSGTFRPEKLEQALNSYATEGWLGAQHLPGSGQYLVCQHLARHDSP